MSIYVKTTCPHELLSAIREKVNKNMVDSWEVDSDGDFTHKSEQWRYKAWFHPVIEDDRVVFAIWGRKSKNMSVEEYAAYHGKFVRMLLVHFDHQVNSIEVTPLATTYDSIRVEKVQNDKS